MRVLIDEDTAVQVVEPLRRVLVGHEIDHVYSLHWGGKKDRPVLHDAKQAGYDVFITRDRHQLADPDECDAIKKSGLHHVRYEQRAGAYGLALALAAIIAAMPRVIEELEGTRGQRLVWIIGLNPVKKRYGLTDPGTDAPPYWGRRPRRGS
jgi:PIN like domain